MRLKYAGRAARSGCTSSPALERGARRRARRTATGGSSRCRRTPRCSSCASCSSRAARRKGSFAMTIDVIWHDVECGRYAADLPLWRELADAARRPGARRRRRHRPGHARPRAPRPSRSSRWTSTPALLPRCASAPATCPSRPSSPMRAASISTAAASASILAPMQTHPAARRRRRRAGFLRCRARAPRARRAARLRDGRRDGGLRRVELRAAAARHDDHRRHELLQPADRAARPRRPDGDRARARASSTPRGERSSSDDVIHLDKVGTEQVEAEARRRGLSPLGTRVIAPTEEHVGHEVVMLRG